MFRLLLQRVFGSQAVMLSTATATSASRPIDFRLRCKVFIVISICVPAAEIAVDVCEDIDEDRCGD